MFGLAAIPLMLVAGVAVDYGRAVTTKTTLQAAADAAALAAARAEGNDAVRSQAGLDIFNKHIAADPKLAKLSARLSVKLADDTATAGAEVVQPNLFLNIVTSEVNPISVKAQAKTANRRPVCMLALDETASPAIGIVGAAGITAPDCVVQANSTASNSIRITGAGKGVAEEFCTVGGYTSNGNGFTPPPIGNCPKVENPLANLPPPGPGDCDVTYGPASAIPAVINPGANKSVCINGTVLSRAGGTVLTIDGGTLHLIGNNSGLSITGNASVNIEAPATGRYAGIAVAQHGVTVRGTSTITGTGDVNFTGTLYMPNQNIDMRGTGQISALSPAWSIVAATFDIRGTPDIVINSDFETAGYGKPIVRTMGGVVLVK
jgi:Flp pilus assembly protein TadG